MKLKYAYIPYILIIVILPAVIFHIGPPFGITSNTWNLILDGLMAAAAVIGLIAVLIQRKSKFRGWIPLLVLAVFFLLPQIYLLVTQDRGFRILRQIYRFALLYITLFVVPMEIRFSRKALCILIGCFVIYGLICCAYEVSKHPQFWKTMTFFGSAKGSVESFFQQKNRFGAYLALWIILCVFAVQISHSKLWLIPAGIFAVFLITTESRGGLLLLGVFLIVMLLSYRRRLGTSNMLMILLDVAIVLGILWVIPVTRAFIRSIIDVDRGVTGRDTLWKTALGFYMEGNHLLGYGIGVEIEKMMIERVSLNYSTHNVYLYILLSGGISLAVFYILSFAIILRHPGRRHHYLTPLVIGIIAYGFFELACLPFDYWHLSNMFTVCLFFIPAVCGMPHHHHHHHHHVQSKDGVPIYTPEREIDPDEISDMEYEAEQAGIPAFDAGASAVPEISGAAFDFEKAVAEEKARLSMENDKPEQ